MSILAPTPDHADAAARERVAAVHRFDNYPDPRRSLGRSPEISGTVEEGIEKLSSPRSIRILLRKFYMDQNLLEFRLAEPESIYTARGHILLNERTTNQQREQLKQTVETGE